MSCSLPSISIVIPNFNSGRLLERALESVLSQQYPMLQLILADGGSTDESRQTIERYRDHFAVILPGPDGGQADGLNRGFDRAIGEVRGWLCADDELLPGSLHAVGEFFASHPDLSVLTGPCERVFADGSRYVVSPKTDPWLNLGVQSGIEQPSTFWRSCVHLKAGEIDTSYHLAFDWDLWNRFKLAGGAVATTDRVLSRYYFSDQNKSGSAGRGHADESFRIVRRYGPFGLAHVFRFLYRHFDLHGCYDNPPTCGLLRSHMFIWTLAALRAVIGKRLLYLYNWHFASCQERGLKWW